MTINLRDITGQKSGIIPEKPYEEDPYGFAREKLGEAYSALYEALEALESVGADFCTDLGYYGDTMEGQSLLDVVSDIENSLEGM